MIRVNGIPLDNPSQGWLFRKGSVPYSGFEADLTHVQVAGRDGNVPTSLTVRAPVWPLKVQTAPGKWETLNALFRSPTLVLTRDDMPGVEASVRFVALSPDRVYDRNEWVDATFYVEITGAYWRAKVESTVSKSLAVASETLDVFPGLSAPVPDAVVRMKGQASGVQVTDASGAWVIMPAATSTQYVRFESATGKCFLTTTDTWAGGTDISGQVDFGGPRNVFEITHVINSSDLTTKGRLTIASGSRSGAILAVRGKSAHAL